MSFTLDKTTIISNGADLINATVTVSHCGSGVLVYLRGEPSGMVLMPSPGVTVTPPATSASFTIRPRYPVVGTPQTTTVTASMTEGGAGISHAVTQVPITPTLTISPDTLVNNWSNESATATINTRVPVYGDARSFSLSDNSSAVYPSSNWATVPEGQTSVTFLVHQGTWVSAPTTATVYASMYYSQFGSTVASAQVRVLPVGGTVSPVNIGVCKHCVSQAGHPINIAMGNVWVQQRDFSLPGLAGGLELVRTWNSLWKETDPWPGLDDAFGYGWRSNLTERLAPWGPSQRRYWRGDGSAWTFNYNSSTGIYTLSYPADERPQLVYSSVTQRYTLTFADGTKKLFNYDGYLVAIVDRNGNQTDLTYDGSNRLIRATDAAGRVLNLRYNNGAFPKMVSSIDDASGTIATYTSNAARQLVRVAYVDGSSLNIEYGPSSYMLLAVRNGGGKLLESHTYDWDHRGLTSARANGVDSVTFSYPPSSQNSGQTQVEDSMGNLTTYTFAVAAGRRVVTAVSGPGCSSCGGRGNQAIVYDTLGNITSTTDALGRVTSYTYDTMGRVLTKSVQLDAQTTLTWSYTYNSFGQVLTATDPAGNVTTNTYDVKGNLLSTRTPPPAPGQQGLTTSFEYDVKGQLTRVTDPRGNQTTLTYTTAGLLATITDAQNKTTTFGYDYGRAGAGDELRLRRAQPGDQRHVPFGTLRELHLRCGGKPAFENRPQGGDDQLQLRQPGPVDGEAVSGLDRGELRLRRAEPADAGLGPDGHLRLRLRQPGTAPGHHHELLVPQPDSFDELHLRCGVEPGELHRPGGRGYELHLRLAEPADGAGGFCQRLIRFQL